MARETMYADVVASVRDTIEQINKARGGSRACFVVDCLGGFTAKVHLSDKVNVVYTVSLPTMDATRMLSKVEADRIIAYVVHELLHVWHTDVAGGIMEQAHKEGGVELGRILNAIEDVRIERKEIEHGPFDGTRDLLSGLLDSGLQDLATMRGELFDADDVSWTIACMGRIATGHYSELAKAMTDGAVPANQQEALQVALDGLPACKSTAGALALARKVLGVQQGQQGKGGQQDGQQGQQGKPEGAGEGGHEGGIGDPLAPTFADASPGGSDDDAIKEYKRTRDLEKYRKTVFAAQRAVVTANVSRPVIVQSGGNNEGYANTLRGRVPSQAMVRDKVRRILRAQERTLVQRRELAGRLDRRAMARASMGARDVFQTKTVTPGVETDVVILLDLSSSMEEDRKFPAAQATAIALASAVENAGGGVMVAGFMDTDEQGKPGLRVFKDWHERACVGDARIAASGCPYGTPMSPAIMACANILARRKVTRRILMTLTDGECNFGSDMVKQANHYARAKGVLSIGIGIMTDVGDKWPDGATKVDDLSKLASVALGDLARILRV